MKSQKRTLRLQTKLEKRRQKDFERYGLKREDVEKESLTKKQKNKKGWKALSRCLVYFKSHRFGIGFIIFLSIIFSTISLFDAMFVERMITYIGILDINNSIKYAIIIAVLSIMTPIIIWGWAIIMTKIFQRVINKLRVDLIDCISRTKTSKFDEVNSGAIISRVNTDTSAVTDAVNLTLSYLINILSAIAFTIYICFINIWLGLLLIISVIVFSIFENGYQKHNYIMRKKQKIVSDCRVGLVSEIARGIRDIKSLNIRSNVQRKFNENSMHMENVTVDRDVGNNAWRIWRRFAQVFFDLGIVLLGIYLLAEGQITVGALVVTIFYKGQSMHLIQYLADVREAFGNAKVSAERICEILDDKDYEKESFGTKKISEPIGTIEFKNVDFKYKNGATVFEDFDLKIEPNQSVAFVGKSGQGKSTLLSLIPRLYDVTGGKILIDGVDIKDLSEDGLRELVTVVPQNPYIFNTSIRENLKFVQEDLTEEEMIEVCKKAQIHDFIMTKEKGYDSVIGENGLILSGGQRQRLAIARGLLKKSKIILFDEATSSLDNENQKKIQDIILELSKTHTILVVAHRLSTVVNCDEIIMIDGGKIVSKGKHKELMKNCTEYKELYKIEQDALKIEE
ncbi:MAG: ABC transporter ATP-binding protein [Clostridia bacterium]|nr:ABC transporter ATP-binding protein [Clostridia bacterium]